MLAAASQAMRLTTHLGHRQCSRRSRWKPEQ